MICFAAKGKGEPGGAGAREHFGGYPHSVSTMPRTVRLVLQLSQADVLPQQSTERIHDFRGSSPRPLCLMLREHRFLLRLQLYGLWSPRNLTGIILTIYLYFMFCCSILTKRMRKLLIDGFIY